MSIRDRIGKLMVKAKRNDFKFTHLLVGEKEYEELENMEELSLSEDEEEYIKKYSDIVVDLHIVKVNKSEYLEICSVLE